jgi:type II secretory pathway pseudopilin PulG
MTARDEGGFTLVELLVTMAIAMVVFGATLAVIEVFQRDNIYAQQRNENQDNARSALDRISRTLRNVIAPGETGAGSLEQGDEYSLMFQTVDTSSSAFGENTAHAMRVRYCLDDSKPAEEVFWTQVQKWKSKETPATPSTSSCPADVTAGGWETKTQLVRHVTNRAGGQNQPLFTYSASEAPQTLTVQTNLFTNLNPSQSRPGEAQLTSAVSLRNANRKPVAVFTVTAEAGKEAYRFNASESYDPDGLALTYKWWENGTLLPNTTQIFTKKLESGKQYKFKLQVTNPGGLSAETLEKLVEPK